MITAADLESARRRSVRGTSSSSTPAGIATGATSRRYFVESPGTYKEAGEWLRDRRVKGFGIDCQALDHPLGTAIGVQPNGPLDPRHRRGVRRATPAGAACAEDFPIGSRATERSSATASSASRTSAGRSMRSPASGCTFAAFPWRWVKGDGCIVRLVAIVDPTGDVSHRDGRGAVMDVTRLADAQPYEAPKHFDMRRRSGCRASTPAALRASGSACRTSCPAAAREHGRDAAREGLRRRRGRGDGHH